MPFALTLITQLNIPVIYLVLPLFVNLKLFEDVKYEALIVQRNRNLVELERPNFEKHKIINLPEKINNKDVSKFLKKLNNLSSITFLIIFILHSFCLVADFNLFFQIEPKFHNYIISLFKYLYKKFWLETE